MRAQDREAERVEGVDRDAGGACAEQRVSRVAHLGRRAAREGDGEAVLRRHAAVRHQVRDAVRQRAGLAGAGPGEDQQRPFDDLGGAALLRIERAEHGVVVLERGRVLGQE